MTPDEAEAERIIAEAEGRVPIDAEADDVEALWLSVERHAELQRSTDDQQSVVEEDLGSLPIGIGFLADTHIGSKWVDMRRLREFAQEVGRWRERHPGALRLQLLGDGTDAYVPGMGRVSKGLLEETETDLEKQDEMFILVATWLGGLNDIMLGCHWLWTVNMVGRNPLKHIAPKVGARDNGYGLFLRAHVGDQVYSIVSRHKGKGLSALNTTNAHRVIYTQYEVPGAERADAIALAHLHIPNLHVQHYAGKRTAWISAPGWKGGDCYARSIAAKHHADTGQGGMPVAIFYPDEHRFMAFDAADWRTALVALEYERRRYTSDRSAPGQRA